MDTDTNHGMYLAGSVTSVSSVVRNLQGHICDANELHHEPSNGRNPPPQEILHGVEELGAHLSALWKILGKTFYGKYALPLSAKPGFLLVFFLPVEDAAKPRLCLRLLQHKRKRGLRHDGPHPLS